MPQDDRSVDQHPMLGRMAIELERTLRTRDLSARRLAWSAFERAVLDHMHGEEVELLPAKCATNRLEVETLLAEHHEIREALVRGRCALDEADPKAALLAVSSFRLHQIREESGVHMHLMPRQGVA